MSTDTEEASYDYLSQGEAEIFFSEFYRGSHHIPGGKVHEFGRGWMVKHDRGELATYDFNELTRLVLMAHRDCYRVGIDNHGPKSLKIMIWKRKREGSMSQRHPTIEDAIEAFNE